MKYKTTFLLLLIFQCASLFSQTDKARELMHQYRYRDAIEILDQLPETRENTLLKAEIHEKLYNYTSAIHEYEKLLSEHPHDLDLVISLAETTWQAGDADASLNYWTLANQLSPDNLFLQTKKTIAHYRAEDWEGTIAAAEEVFKKDSLSMLLRHVGDAYIQMGDALGIEYYKDAIAQNPSDYLAVTKLGNFFYGAQMYDSVINRTEDYLQHINPNQKMVGQLNGMAYYSAGEYRKAINRLKANIELRDSSYTTTYFLGMSYFASKLYFDATKWLTKAYETGQQDVNLLYYYGTALSRTYDRKRGIEVLQEGVDKIEKLNEMLPDFDLSFADAYQRSDNLAKAIDYYQSALKRRPSETPLLYNIASAYDRMKDHKNAIAYYERFLKTAPKDFVLESSTMSRLDASKMSTTDFYYNVSHRRIKELQEELFFQSKKK